MTTKRVKEKLCPLSQQTCLRKRCALWIKVHKQSVNPLFTLYFRGCGLIQNIPWGLKKETAK